MDTMNTFSRLASSLKRIQSGQHYTVDTWVIAFLAGVHIIVEGDPGNNKTNLAKRTAQTVEGSFGRVQFTPDLLPADVTGYNAIVDGSNETKFVAGPALSTIVLADEINRATPKTQSALLEIMEEAQVTVGGTTHKAPAGFTVIATQNSIEQEGTYPLPEAQLDRFGVKLYLNNPSEDDLTSILSGSFSADFQETEMVPISDVMQYRTCCAIDNPVIRFDETLDRYIARMLTYTSAHPDVSHCMTTRAGITIKKLAKAVAMASGRTEVLASDIKGVAPHAINHRLILHESAMMQNIHPLAVASQVVSAVPAPVEA